MSDLDLNTLLYGKNEKKEGANEQKDTGYEQILNRVRDGITTNHAAELAHAIDDEESAVRLKGLIGRYITQNSLKQENTELKELIDRIYEDMAGFGFLTKYIQDEDVEEININAWNDIEIITRDRWWKTGEKFISPQHCQDIAKKMMRMGGIIIDNGTPTGDSFISRGTRVSAIIPPCVDEEVGAVLSVRKQKKVTFTREQLIEWGTATGEELDLIRLCLIHGISVAICGATGSGKTADISFFLHSVPDDKRIYSIEDSLELDAVKKDGEGNILNRVIHTKTRLHKDDERNVDEPTLLRRALRFHPDIIVPAEMRGKETVSAVEAGRTGETILSSFHGKNARDGYKRLLTMYMMGGTELSEELVMDLIISAFPIMIFKKHLPDGSRRYMEIFEAQGYENRQVVGRTIFRFVVTGSTVENGRIKITGEHKKVQAISDNLASELLENGASVKDIQRYAGNGWKPGLDNGG